MKTSGYIIIAFAIVFAGAFFYFLSKGMNDNGIEVAIHETNEELIFLASFPKKDSERVQEYVQAALNMTNLPDLANVEVKKYQTPDDMRFHIKSKSGYIKIVLDKSKNHSQACQKIRDTAKGVSRLLAQS
jgi:glutaredoxin 2